MTFRPRRFLTALTLLLLGGSLAGCASLNEKAAAAMGDYVPQWAGGLPADAPPRPGTAKYDEWMKERERLRQLPADQRPPDPLASSSATSKPFAWSSSPTASRPSPSSTTSKPASSTSSTSATSSTSTPSGQDPAR